MIQVAACSAGVTHDGFKEIRALLFLLARDWPGGGVTWHSSANETKRKICSGDHGKELSPAQKERKLEKENACFVPILSLYFCSYCARTWFLEGRQSFISKSEQAQEWETNPLRMTVWEVGASWDDPNELLSPPGALGDLMSEINAHLWCVGRYSVTFSQSILH